MAWVLNRANESTWLGGSGPGKARQGDGEARFFEQSKRINMAGRVRACRGRAWRG